MQQFGKGSPFLSVDEAVNRLVNLHSFFLQRDATFSDLERVCYHDRNSFVNSGLFGPVQLLLVTVK